MQRLNWHACQPKKTDKYAAILTLFPGRFIIFILRERNKLPIYHVRKFLQISKTKWAKGTALSGQDK